MLAFSNFLIFFLSFFFLSLYFIYFLHTHTYIYIYIYLFFLFRQAHGDVFLRPNVVHWIPRPDAVHLIRDGIAEEVGDADIFTRT